MSVGAQGEHKHNFSVGCACRQCRSALFSAGLCAFGIELSACCNQSSFNWPFSPLSECLCREQRERGSERPAMGQKRRCVRASLASAFVLESGTWAAIRSRTLRSYTSACKQGSSLRWAAEIRLTAQLCRVGLYLYLCFCGFRLSSVCVCVCVCACACVRRQRFRRQPLLLKWAERVFLC